MAFSEGNGRRMMESCAGNLGGGGGDDGGDRCCEDEDALLNYPVKVRTTLRYIKEISRKHSFDDIYSMLRECNMDPNETVQKLLFVDPFREVKHKHSKRRSNTDTSTSERRRLVSGVLQRGGGAGRGNNFPAYTLNDGGGHRRQAAVRQENGGPYHKEHNQAASRANLSVVASNGNSINEPSRGAPIAETRHLGKQPALPNVAMKQLHSSNPGPTPSPTPTNASTVSSGMEFVGEISESQSADLPVSPSSASVSGVYSSALDPVLLPPLNLHNPGAVGTIKQETGNQQCPSGLSGSSWENGLNGGQEGTSGSQEGVGIANGTSQRAEKSKTSEPSKASSCLGHGNPSPAAILDQDDWSLEQVSGPSKVIKTHVGSEVQGASMQSISKFSDPVMEKGTTQLDMKLEKLKLSTHQPVIFPDHIQVPEELRVGLTFGSLHDASVPSKNMSKDSTGDPSVLIGQDAAREPPLCNQTAAPAVQTDDYTGHLQTHREAIENLSPLEINALSASTPPKSDQLKQSGILPHIGGLQYPFYNAAPEYGFGLVPPILGAHLVQVEAAEVGSSVTSSSSQPAQPVGIGQNSVPVSPQFFPFLRPPLLSNYVPYNPYFSQVYMPHGSQQFMSHGGFPHQASANNMYMPPPAATGAKYPISPAYKPGTIAGNPVNFGIPSGYGLYGPSAVGYGLGASMTPSTSASNEDLAAPEPKDRNIYSALKQCLQNEQPLILTSVPARDISSLPGNFYYNFPPGQQVAFPPAHSGQGPKAGMYHQTQRAGGAAATSAQLPSQQQSQPIAGPPEPAFPPSGGAYQQTHSQINWNT